MLDPESTPALTLVSQDADPGTASPATDSPATDSPAIDSLGADDLVEEVSIDGMCGVY